MVLKGGFTKGGAFLATYITDSFTHAAGMLGSVHLLAQLECWNLCAGYAGISYV